MATDHITVHVSDPSDIRKGIDWWLDLTDKGGEGMVVKPMDFIARDQRGILQPAVKCRGMEALKLFADNEPLHRIHQCVFGVLALESEPVDPRL